MTDKEEVMKRAKALGESLRESDEYKELMEAQKNLDEDAETQELLKNYESKRNELQVKQMTGQNIDDDLRELTDMEGQIMNKESMQRYTKAEENFKNLVDEANQEIVNAMGENNENTN